MSLLYINENGAVIGIEGCRCTVKYTDGMKRSLPIESLEAITIMGKSQMTTQCMEECLKRGIPVAFFSKGGAYFGRLQSTGHVNVERQRKQCALYDTEFALELSRRILEAKLKNQSVVLRRYGKSRKVELTEMQKMLAVCQKKVGQCGSISEMIGYEGQGAKYYFKGLAQCVEESFYFTGRSRRPPLDKFNSMLSLGYSILMNEVYCKIETKGLNPYYGFLHKDAEKHPTLASDLMEEWRAVIVDSTVMSMINGHEIEEDDFVSGLDQPGIYMQKKGLKKYLTKLEKKFQTSAKYLQYVDFVVTFRRAIQLQVNQLAKAIEMEDPQIYEPIRIR